MWRFQFFSFQKSSSIHPLRPFYFYNNGGHHNLQKRYYSIIDKYSFPKTPEQIKQEEELKQRKEDSKYMSYLQNRRSEQMKWLVDNAANAVIKEAPMDVKWFKYVPPIQPENPHLLHVAVIGAPNAGKSTLINRMVGAKISAVSTKSHTTRQNILGVLTVEDTQICFIDTPGIIDQSTSSKISSALAHNAWDSINDADIVMLLVDSVKTITGNKTLFHIVQSLQEHQKKSVKLPPLILVLNKIDLMDKIKDRYPVLARFERFFPNLKSIFSHIFQISALNGSKVVELQNWLVGQAKPNPWIYHSDTKTPRSDLELAEEIIREKIFKRLNREIPYQIRLENVGWTVLPNGVLRIDETIYVKKKNHKRVVLGISGRGIYGIVETATHDIRALLHRDIDLRMDIKVYKGPEVEEQ